MPLDNLFWPAHRLREYGNLRDNSTYTRVYAHETVVKGFVNLNMELSSIQEIKSAF